MKLTERELELALESGGPTLCAIHAAEVVLDAGDASGDDVA